MLKIAENEAGEEAGEMQVTLDELVREGARRMLVAALEAEVAAYVKAHLMMSHRFVLDTAGAIG